MMFYDWLPFKTFENNRLLFELRPKGFSKRNYQGIKHRGLKLANLIVIGDRESGYLIKGNGCALGTPKFLLCLQVEMF